MVAPGHEHGRFRRLSADLRAELHAQKPNVEELKANFEAWRAAREERRREHRFMLLSKWGGAIAEPSVQSELSLHAERMAKLARMEEVAGTEKTGEERTRLLARIDKLRDRETRRHEQAMGRLTTPHVPAPTPSASSPLPAASGVTP